MGIPHTVSAVLNRKSDPGPENMMRTMRALPGLALALLIGGSVAHAQTATGLQDLNFGTVFPGVPEVVVRTDAARGGRFDVRGFLLLEVRITMTLPATLNASGGRTIPLVWGANDGGRNTSNNAATATAFDPRVPMVTRFGLLGRLYIFLGGRANPGPTTTAGTYTATITLTAAYTGN